MVKINLASASLYLPSLSKLSRTISVHFYFRSCSAYQYIFHCVHCGTILKFIVTVNSIEVLNGEIWSSSQLETFYILLPVAVPKLPHMLLRLGVDSPLCRRRHWRCPRTNCKSSPRKTHCKQAASMGYFTWFLNFLYFSNSFTSFP